MDPSTTTTHHSTESVSQTSLINRVEGWFDDVFRKDKSTPITASHPSQSINTQQHEDEQSKHHANLYGSAPREVVDSHKSRSHSTQFIPAPSRASSPAMMSDNENNTVADPSSDVTFNDANQTSNRFSIASPLYSSTESVTHPPVAEQALDFPQNLGENPSNTITYAAHHEPPTKLLGEVTQAGGHVPNAHHVDLFGVEHSSVPLGHVVDKYHTAKYVKPTHSTSSRTDTTQLTSPVSQQVLKQVKQAAGHPRNEHHVDVSQVEHSAVPLGHVVEPRHQPTLMPSTLTQRLMTNDASSLPEEPTSYQLLSDTESNVEYPKHSQNERVEQSSSNQLGRGAATQAADMNNDMNKAQDRFEELIGAPVPQPQPELRHQLEQSTILTQGIIQGIPEHADLLPSESIEVTHKSQKSTLKQKMSSALHHASELLSTITGPSEVMSHPNIPHANVPTKVLKDVKTQKGRVPHASHVDIEHVENQSREASSIEYGDVARSSQPSLIDKLRVLPEQISFALNEKLTGASQPIHSHPAIPHAALPNEVLQDVKRQHGHPVDSHHVDVSQVERSNPELGHVLPGPTLFDKIKHALLEPEPIHHRDDVPSSALPDQVLIDVKKQRGQPLHPHHIDVSNVEHSDAPLGHVVAPPQPTLMEKLTHAKDVLNETLMAATIPAALPARDDIPKSALPQPVLKDIKMQHGIVPNSQHVHVIEHSAVPLGHVQEVHQPTLIEKVGAALQSATNKIVAVTQPSQPATYPNIPHSSLSTRVLDEIKSNNHRLHHVDPAQVERMGVIQVGNVTSKPATPIHFPHSVVGKKVLQDVKLHQGVPQNPHHVDIQQAEARNMTQPIGRVMDESPHDPLTHASTSNDNSNIPVAQRVASYESTPASLGGLLPINTAPAVRPHDIAWINNDTNLQDAQADKVKPFSTAKRPHPAVHRASQARPTFDHTAVAPHGSTSNIAWMNTTHGSAVPTTSKPDSDFPIQTAHASDVPITSRTSGAPVVAHEVATESPFVARETPPTPTLPAPLLASAPPSLTKTSLLPSAAEASTLPRSDARAADSHPALHPSIAPGHASHSQIEKGADTIISSQPSTRTVDEVVPSSGGKKNNNTANLASLIRSLPTDAVPLVGGAPATAAPLHADLKSKNDEAARKEANKHKDASHHSKSDVNKDRHGVISEQLPSSSKAKTGMSGRDMDLNKDGIPDHHQHHQKSGVLQKIKDTISGDHGHAVSDSNDKTQGHQRDDLTLTPSGARLVTNSTPTTGRHLSDPHTRPREMTPGQAVHKSDPHHERHLPIINPSQASSINTTHVPSDANIGRIAEPSLHQTLPKKEQQHTMAETMPLSTTHVDPHTQQVQSRLLLQPGPVGLDNSVVKDELTHLEGTKSQH